MSKFSKEWIDIEIRLVVCKVRLVRKQREENNIILIIVEPQRESRSMVPGNSFFLCVALPLASVSVTYDLRYRDDM